MIISVIVLRVGFHRDVFIAVQFGLDSLTSRHIIGDATFCRFRVSRTLTSGVRRAV